MSLQTARFLFILIKLVFIYQYVVYYLYNISVLRIKEEYT